MNSNLLGLIPSSADHPLISDLRVALCYNKTTRATCLKIVSWNPDGLRRQGGRGQTENLSLRRACCGCYSPAVSAQLRRTLLAIRATTHLPETSTGWRENRRLTEHGRIANDPMRRALWRYTWLRTISRPFVIRRCQGPNRSFQRTDRRATQPFTHEAGMVGSRRFSIIPSPSAMGRDSEMVGKAR